MQPNFDILQYLFDKANKIDSLSEVHFTIGARYVASQNKNGQIGVCATLNTYVDKDAIQTTDFSNRNFRVMVNAYANATLNYIAKADGHGDIFEVVDFSRFKNIVMIGYFGSLVQKLQARGVSTTAFDIDQSEAPVMPMDKQQEYLSGSDCVILTSTSLGNRTFDGIIAAIPSECSVFMLGPSTPLDDIMFSIPQIKGLFGSIFPLNHNETLNLIANGFGTRDFMCYMQKVYRLSN